MAEDKTEDAEKLAEFVDLDNLVVRVANESSVVDSVVLLCAELGDKFSHTDGDPEKVRALVNQLNIHQHHFAVAVDVKHVDEMPAGELPAEEARKRAVREANDAGEPAKPTRGKS